MKKILFIILAAVAVSLTGCATKEPDPEFVYQEPYTVWNTGRADMKKLAPTSYRETDESLDVYNGNGFASEFWYQFDSNDRLVTISAIYPVKLAKDVSAYLEANYTFSHDSMIDGVEVRQYYDLRKNSAVGFGYNPLNEFCAVQYYPYSAIYTE